MPVTIAEFRRKAREQGIPDKAIDNVARRVARFAEPEPEPEPEPFSLGQVPLANDPNRFDLRPGPLQNAPQNITNTSAQGVPITQQFGNFNPGLYRGINRSGRNTGVDFGLPEGSPVTLPEGNWEVTDTGRGWNSGFGNSIMVKNIQTGESLRFSHLSKMAPVKRGQRIGGKTTIALTGSTGNVTGPHLDLEYRNKSGVLGNILTSRYGRFF